MLSSARPGSLVERELSAFRAAHEIRDLPTAWRALERAHIASQTGFAPHCRVHIAMLWFALQQRDAREVLGQSFRLMLVPVGHAFRRLPVGNTGRSNVSAFVPMPMPEDLAAELKR